MDAELLKAQQILLVRDFVSQEEADALIQIYEQLKSRATNQDYSRNPVVHFLDVMKYLPFSVPLMRHVTRKALVQVAAAFPFIPPIYAEAVFVAGLPLGGVHPRHADNCEQDANLKWVPNHTPKRDISSIIYLNDAFEGGEIIFPTRGFRVKPTRGLFLAFPSGQNHEHEVPPVLSGNRYSMPVWMTKTESASIREIPGVN